ncbi:mechanosensitive ion channel family protein [Panacibacter ginsenosidivorans]|uniref:Mechanosensitive ion channel family protein n=1 Tax=Panacibacter ginsenosidivorans TaxID=1813871 RepID=A0A5B8VFD0_9BACT|nr:mechanosensitive ion channel family protein [Panacibacter ginsenosidivorans]QEC69741.1 mechanosensitive ion channel family protein [Panacibacter ginsenosidivorans]
MNNLWGHTYLGNDIKTWLIVSGIIIGGFLTTRFFKGTLLKKFKRWSKNTKSSFDDFIVVSFEKYVIPFLYFLIVYAALSYLHMPQVTEQPIHTAMLLICTYFILQIINSALQYFLLSVLKNQDGGETKQKQARGLIIIIKAIVWIMGVVFVLDNLGYNVSTIIAGLGIGGIAIALAAQTILGDLFSYFVILFDRPFEIGDFIIVDDKMGAVEYIGIKTTRLRTLGGEQLVCSNKDLTDSRVHNYKRMEKRRVVFNIGVTYQTTSEKLKAIPVVVKNIISKTNDVLFDRGHFSAFGDSSLNFEFVYFILSSDYALYMDKQQAVNFEIFETFEKMNIDFAYPTSTVFINKEQPVFE